jgi:hypothetical protein
MDQLHQTEMFQQFFYNANNNSNNNNNNSPTCKSARASNIPIVLSTTTACFHDRSESDRQRFLLRTSIATFLDLFSILPDFFQPNFMHFEKGACKQEMSS